MNFKSKFIFTMSLLAVGTVFLFRGNIEMFSNRFFGQLMDIQDSLEKAVEENKEVLTPGPLRSLKDSDSSFLTKEGVIVWTNKQRQQSGLPSLTENLKLNSSAHAKVSDMFQKQYFEHVSPSGAAVSQLAEENGYRFIAIGENLALGNFKNDEELVRAWMDSPGHRANIMSKKFQEIGVSVVKGQFEGKTTWLAVQHFGLSLDLCVEPDKSLQASIDNREVELLSLRRQLDTLKAQVDGDSNGPLRKGNSEASKAEHNKFVDKYNTLIRQYNNLLDEHRLWISRYNAQVQTFNSCLQSYK